MTRGTHLKTLLTLGVARRAAARRRHLGLVGADHAVPAQGDRRRSAPHDRASRATGSSPAQVTVSVYNASDRVGLAEPHDDRSSRTRASAPATVGNAPKGAVVAVRPGLDHATATTRPSELVVSRLGPGAHRRAARAAARRRRRGGRRRPRSTKLVQGKLPSVEGHLQPTHDLLAARLQPRRGALDRLSSPSHGPSRPCARDRAQPRARSRSRSLRGVTTSRSSPCRRTVRRSGTIACAVADHHRDRRTRRQPQLADLDPVQPRDRADRHLQQVGRDPLERRHLEVEAARLGAPGRPAGTCATSGSVGPVSRV